ncbi:MAG: protein of unknown function (DUF1830) [Phormidesmis priestleyi Ana]|uniref:DUF1830 domain-containing protein n=1 Tax=Phormidesmis priestleyi Ana TaxID=1666911 RepID=A0A0P8DDK6_9CYAN|nr:MAG: protein of unknown function (DUF1830) [Phormidesmis priestleyi Ana]
MAQIIDPLPSDKSDVLLCCYVNATSKIQIARVTNVPDWYFERVVFPGQRLLFEAVSTAMLEIHTGMMASAILSDTIPCQRLVVEAEENLDATMATRLDADSVTSTSGSAISGSVISGATIESSRESGRESGKESGRPETGTLTGAIAE